MALHSLLGEPAPSEYLRKGRPRPRFEAHLPTRNARVIGVGVQRRDVGGAHLISDGWAAPFQKLTSDTPVVARIFSQICSTVSARDSLVPVAVRDALVEVLLPKSTASTDVLTGELLL